MSLAILHTTVVTPGIKTPTTPTDLIFHFCCIVSHHSSLINVAFLVTFLSWSAPWIIQCLKAQSQCGIRATNSGIAFKSLEEPSPFLFLMESMAKLKTTMKLPTMSVVIVLLGVVVVDDDDDVNDVDVVAMVMRLRARRKYGTI
jgi:hypothetical protein